MAKKGELKKEHSVVPGPVRDVFKARLDIIGVNPFVFVPKRILRKIFLQAGKDKGPIPVEGTVNGKQYCQTLVRYRGDWRLYVNTIMLSKSPQHVGEMLNLTIAHDPKPRGVKPPMEFLKALKENNEAQAVFDRLPAYMKNEIVRYLANLKTAASLEKNIKRAIRFLTGEERFVGRQPLKKE